MSIIFGKDFTRELFENHGLLSRLDKLDFTFSQIKHIAFCTEYDWASREEARTYSGKFYSMFRIDYLEELITFLEQNRQEVIDKLLENITSTFFTKDVLYLDPRLEKLFFETKIDILIIRNLIFYNTSNHMRFKRFNSDNKIVTDSEKIIEVFEAIKNRDEEVEIELIQASDHKLTTKQRKEAMFNAIQDRKFDKIQQAKQRMIDQSALFTEQYLECVDGGTAFCGNDKYMIDPNYDLSKLDHIRIYCDGAYRIYEGRGSYSYITCDKNDRELYSRVGLIYNETSQRAELLACLLALNTLKKPCKIEVFTDSEYLRFYCINKDCFVKRDTKNYDLINRIISVRDKHILLDVEYSSPESSPIFAKVDAESKRILKR